MSTNSIQSPSGTQLIPYQPISSEETLFRRVQSVVLQILAQYPQKPLQDIQNLALTELIKDSDPKAQAITKMVENLLKDFSNLTLYKAITNLERPFDFDEAKELFSSIFSNLTPKTITQRTQDLYLTILTEETHQKFPMTSLKESRRVLHNIRNSIQNFKISALKNLIKKCFQEQKQILFHYFTLLINEQVFNGCFKNLPVTFYSSEDSLKFWDNFSEQYQIVLNWIKTKNNLPLEEIKKLNDFPESPFTLFFQAHLEKIYCNALICAKARSELDRGFLFREFRKASFEEVFSIQDRVTAFLNDQTVLERARLYTAYKTFYPGSSHEQFFSILWETRLQNLEASDKAFLEEERDKERKALIDSFLENSDSFELFFFRIFYTPEDIQKIKTQFQIEYREAQEIVERLTKPSLQQAWNTFQNSTRLITYEQFKKIVLKSYEFEIYKILSSCEVVNPTRLDQEYRKFQEAIPKDEVIDDFFSLFSYNLKEKWKIQSELTNYLIKVGNRLLSIEDNQKKQELLSYLNDYILLNLTGFFPISVSSKDLLYKRTQDLKKVLGIAENFLKNTDSFPVVRFQVLCREEFQVACRLALIYVFIKNQIKEKYSMAKKGSQIVPGDAKDFFLKDSFISSTAKGALKYLTSAFPNSNMGFSKSYLENKVKYFIRLLLENFPKPVIKK